MSLDDASERHHFKIGEVAELVGVRPHVLRYWEQEFPSLRPKKTRGSHRHYSRENVELARAIRQLVVDEGYSIAGAKRRLAESRHAPLTEPKSDPHVRGATLLEDLLATRAELVALLDRLDGEEGDETDSRDGAAAAENAEENVAPAAVVARNESSRRSRA